MYNGRNEAVRDKQDANDPYGFDSLRAMANFHSPDPIIAKAINEYVDGDGITRDSNGMDVQEGPEGNPAAWQSECLETIQHEKNVILSSPTGSGKTRVFLRWAREKAKQAEAKGENHTVYITAPIKALSNQRFRELKEQGVNVGLETGDIKDVPERADYICCTQEIYTNKYLEDENATLIMDEFHYIFEDDRRARTYIDSLHGSKAQNMLLASATFGNTSKFSDYVNNVSGRNFYNYENDKRITGLEYKGEIDTDGIEDSLVVTFSARNCRTIADYIWSQREKSDSITRQNIDAISSGMKINNDELVTDCKSGVAYYYGSMLPKEKLFVEQLFESRLIDTVVGTDALALGVNFPVKKVIFAQLAKYWDGPISKNLFEQLSGRAGRKGYFNNGEVYYCDFGVEDFDYDTSELFQTILRSNNEDASISLTPNIKGLLMGKTAVEEEASFISRFSTASLDEEIVSKEISETIGFIKGYLPFSMNEKNSDDDYDDDCGDISTEEKQRINVEFQENIANVYFDEFSPEMNCEIFAALLSGYSAEQIIDNPQLSFSDLLQLRKYFRQLPKKYKKNINFGAIEQRINEIDSTALESGRIDIRQFIEINQENEEEE